MKRLNSDKVYKYVPKNNSNEKENLNYSRHLIHREDHKRHKQRNKFINKKKYQYIQKEFINNNENSNLLRCLKCNRVIIDQLNSFHKEDNNEYYCFECALDEAKTLLNPDPKNRVIYLGAGTFGEVKEIKSEKKFMIIKRIKFTKPKFEKFSLNYLPFDQY